MFEFAAEAAGSGYGPNIVGALISGALTGVFAGLVAFFTARHEARQADARRALEQAERDAQDAAMRRDALNRQVVSETTNALTQILSAMYRRDDVAAGDALLWLESRTRQTKMLLHTHGRTDLLEWFNQEWGAAFHRFRELMHPNLKIARWELRVPENEQMDIEAALIALEFLFARWSTQPVEEWSAEKPPSELLTAFPDKVPRAPKEQD